jgi:lipopolysaccharide transport protein LptA
VAVFVVAFAIVVALALRAGKQEPEAGPPVARMDPKAVVESKAIDSKRVEGGRLRWAIKAGTQLTYPDGRSKLGSGVEVTLPRGDRTFTVTSTDAEILPKDNAIQTGKFTGDVVRLSGADGLVVTAREATYDNAEGIVNIPGPVEFAKGRMKGRGIGATYDLNREVLWLLGKAHVTVAPDAKGSGALQADSGSAGIAKLEHYIRLVGEARIEGEGRTMRGDEVTIRLTDDDDRVQSAELRGRSRIDGGQGGPQSMAANDIDLTYGEDGRSLQFAKLMENASVQLAGDGRAGGRRVAGRTIDIALAPDGRTVTNLNATERVQVDLPPDGDAPAKRITADTLVANGTPEAGLREATFAGNAVYRETRAARKTLAAISRTARAQRLVVRTKPGFGAIEQAEFRGHFHFTDGAQTTAEGPHAVYHVEAERIDLTPSEDPGPPPRVTDGAIEVQARTIEFTIAGRRLKADTAVRTSMRPQKKPAAGAEGAKRPSLLNQDEIVFVTANRLEYDGASSRAAYGGNARLWQGKDTEISADTIVVDDRSGNLTATVKVQTRMMVDHEDSKTRKRTRVEQTGRGETFEYDDAKRLATYTTNAHVSGPHGTVTADRIVLFLKEGASELERAEAYEKVTLKEGVRIVQGSKLVFTAADDRYVMTGNQVLIVEEQPKCNEMMAKVAVYDRRTGSMTADGADAATKSQPCTGKRLF